jgi:hypothetical protein
MPIAHPILPQVATLEAPFVTPGCNAALFAILASAIRRKPRNPVVRRAIVRGRQNGRVRLMTPASGAESGARKQEFNTEFHRVHTELPREEFYWCRASGNPGWG